MAAMVAWPVPHYYVLCMSVTHTVVDPLLQAANVLWRTVAVTWMGVLVREGKGVLLLMIA